MGRNHGVREVVDAIVGYLQVSHGTEPAVRRLVERLRAVVPRPERPAAPPRHGRDLEVAVTSLCAAGDEPLAAIGRAVRACSESLAWRVDDGQYYVPGAPVGDGYRHGNMHSVLVEADDFAMGLFLLVPGVDYLDHRHAAPELYLNLTGPTQWRFGFGEWQQMAAGSVVFNEPGRVHATRTGLEPWLSVWAWMGDTDQLCEVVEAPGRV